MRFLVEARLTVSHGRQACSGPVRDKLPFPLRSAMFGVAFLPERKIATTHTRRCMHAYIDLYILCSCFSTEQSERAPGNAPVDANVMQAFSNQPQ